ncbi:MAG: hypothetical protein ACKVT1_05850 [Dehalococcoidia bacterium]
MTSPVVVAESGGAVAVFERREGAWQRTPLSDAGVWPVWRPGRAQAAVSVVEAGRPPTSEVRIVGATPPVETVVAYRSAPGGPAVIAPRIPHYVNWSPAGDVLSVVAPGADGLTLFLSDPEGSYSSDAIVSGGPLFSAWAAAGDCLAIHKGNELVLYWPRERRSVRVTSEAVGFRTPACVGRSVMYARPGGDGVILGRRELDSEDDRDLLSFGGGVAIVARPGAPQVAVAVAADPNTGLFSQLWLVDVLTGEKLASMHRGPFVSATWSPVGDCLALTIPTQSGDGRFMMLVVGDDGRYRAASDGFVPGQDFRTLLGFFDQYAQSHHLWAPDGSAVLMAGRMMGDGVAASFSDGPRDYVLSWATHGREPIEVVGRGDTGFFPPRVNAR